MNDLERSKKIKEVLYQYFDYLKGRGINSIHDMGWNDWMKFQSTKRRFLQLLKDEKPERVWSLVKFNYLNERNEVK